MGADSQETIVIDQNSQLVIGNMLSDPETKIIVDPAHEKTMNGNGGVSGAIKSMYEKKGLLKSYVSDLLKFPKNKDGKRCPNGEARYTNTGGIDIIHVSAPDLREKENLHRSSKEPSEEAKQKLQEAYYHAFIMAYHVNKLQTPSKPLSCPLLGAGIFKWPPTLSAEIAGKAMQTFQEEYGHDVAISLYMREEDLIKNRLTAEVLAEAIKKGQDAQLAKSNEVKAALPVQPVKSILKETGLDATDSLHEKKRNHIKFASKTKGKHKELTKLIPKEEVAKEMSAVLDVEAIKQNPEMTTIYLAIPGYYDKYYGTQKDKEELVLQMLKGRSKLTKDVHSPADSRALPYYREMEDALIDAQDRVDSTALNVKKGLYKAKDVLLVEVQVPKAVLTDEINVNVDVVRQIADVPGLIKLEKVQTLEAYEKRENENIVSATNAMPEPAKLVEPQPQPKAAVVAEPVKIQLSGADFEASLNKMGVGGTKGGANGNENQASVAEIEGILADLTAIDTKPEPAKQPIEGPQPKAAVVEPVKTPLLGADFEASLNKMGIGGTKGGANGNENQASVAEIEDILADLAALDTKPEPTKPVKIQPESKVTVVVEPVKPAEPELAAEFEKRRKRDIVRGKVHDVKEKAGGLKQRLFNALNALPVGKEAATPEQRDNLAREMEDVTKIATGFGYQPVVSFANPHGHQYPDQHNFVASKSEELSISTFIEEVINFLDDNKNIVGENVYKYQADLWKTVRAEQTASQSPQQALGKLGQVLDMVKEDVKNKGFNEFELKISEFKTKVGALLKSAAPEQKVRQRPGGDSGV